MFRFSCLKKQEKDEDSKIVENLEKLIENVLKTTSRNIVTEYNNNINGKKDTLNAIFRLINIHNDGTNEVETYKTAIRAIKKLS